MIRDVQDRDIPTICTIYNHFVQNSVVSFEEQIVSIPEMKTRVGKITRDLPWLVYQEGESVLGFAYATRWKSRPAYRSSVESTIYLSPDSAGRGIGRQLYQALIKQLESLSVHSVIGGIALPNPASIALHESLGFEKVAHFKQVGWKMGRWIDVGYWQLVFQSTDQN